MADKNFNSITFPGLLDKYKVAQVADEYSSSSTYAVGDIVNHLGTTYRCTTTITTAENWTVGHWTPVKIANEVTDLKSAIDEIIEQSPNMFDGVFTDGEQVATSSGAFVAGTSFSRSNHIPINSGNIYFGINADTTQAIGAHYCVYNTGKTKKTAGNIADLPTTVVGSGNNSLKYAVLTASEDGYFAFDVYTEYKTPGRYVSQTLPAQYEPFLENPKVKPECIIVDGSLSVPGLPADAEKTGEIEQSVETLEDALYELKTTETTDAIATTWTANAYMNDTGVVQSNTSYKYSAKIQVEPGDLLSRNGGETFRYVCAFSGNTAISSAGASSAVTEYTVPDGIDSIVVSVAQSTDSLFLTHYTVVKSLASDEKIATIRGGYLSTASSDTMLSGSGLYLGRNSIIRNKKYIFKANVTGSGWSVLVAHGTIDTSFDSDIYSEGYIITPESIIPWSSGNNGTGGSTGTPLAHGITISSRLCVVVSVNAMQIPTVMVMSESGVFSHTYETAFLGRKGNIYAKAMSGSFANTSLVFTCADIEKSVWLFGDSYVSMVSNRYPYWLAENSVDNCLINSYPGEGSVNGLKDLKAVLTYGTPRYLIWALGMNDHDSSDAVNANWLSCVAKVINLCEERGITLILATIPNVANASYNNVYKNIWVEQSGYRYVDFNEAIGAADEPGATWPDEWLSSDNVHPTEMGARVLAMQAIVDVPELAQP